MGKRKYRSLKWTLEEKYGDLFMNEDQEFSCPMCHHRSASKVIAFGLPLKFCVNQNCNCLWGAWLFEWIYVYLLTPIEASLTGGFSFYLYKGPYWRAFWHWLINKHGN
jgi:hypothetical protein